mgnify:CR=1 FL=1
MRMPLTVTDPGGIEEHFREHRARAGVHRQSDRPSVLKCSEFGRARLLNLKTLMRSVVFRVVADIGMLIACGGNIGCTIAFAAMSSASTLMSGGSWRDAIGRAPSER